MRQEPGEGLPAAARPSSRGSGPRTYGVGMRLLAVPDASGRPLMWINADHLVSVMPLFRVGDGVVSLDVELKVDGLPLQRVRLGDHPSHDAAEAAFALFLQRLQE